MDLTVEKVSRHVSYKQLATVLRDVPKVKARLGGLQPVAVIDTDVLIGRMADALATDNPVFDRKRFVKACGGQLL